VPGLTVLFVVELQHQRQLGNRVQFICYFSPAPSLYFPSLFFRGWSFGCCRERPSEPWRSCCIINAVSLWIAEKLEHNYIAIWPYSQAIGLCLCMRARKMLCKMLCTCFGSNFALFSQFCPAVNGCHTDPHREKNSIVLKTSSLWKKYIIICY